jgi:hypothetical protein
MFFLHQWGGCSEALILQTLIFLEDYFLNLES